jgi:hypothetical protein
VERCHGLGLYFLKIFFQNIFNVFNKSIRKFESQRSTFTHTLVLKGYFYSIATAAREITLHFRAEFCSLNFLLR